MSLHENLLRGSVVRHMHGYCTGEMVGYIMYYRVWWNIVASMIKSSEHNQLNNNVDLLDRFIRLICAVCLAYLMLYSTAIIF